MTPYIIKTMIFLTISFILYLISGDFDLFEKIVESVEQYEDYELDEIFVVIILDAIIFLIYYFYKYSRETTLSEQLRINNKRLELANKEIKQLKDIIPICSYCKSIRDDEGYWNSVENYIKDSSGSDFSHSICPECVKKYHPYINE